MAITEIGVGSAANDGTGQSVRAAFQRANGNFLDLQNRLGHFVPLTYFGAAGDGKTDDSAIMQKALDDGNKHILITAAHVLSEVLLPSDAHILFAPGASLVAKAGVTGVNYFFRCAGTAEARKSNIRIEGGTFDCNNLVTGLIRCDYVDDIRMKDVKVINCPTDKTIFGGSVLATANCTKTWVVFCDGVGGRHGVVHDGSVDNKVIGCDFRDTTHDGILFYNLSDDSTAIGNTVDNYCMDTDTGLGGYNGRGGIHFYGVKRSIAIGNTVRNAATTAPDDTGGIRFRDCPNFTCTGNVVYNVSTGILCNQLGDYRGYVTSGTIAGNDVDTCKYSGINVAGNCGRGVISANEVTNCNTLIATQISGISILSNGWACSGNIIDDCPQQAIYVGGSNCSVVGNVSARCGNGSASVPHISCFGTNVLVVGNHMSDDRVTKGYIYVDTQPADGDSVTITGGSTRTITFKTTVTDVTTQVAIGATVKITAENLNTYLGTYGITGYTASYLWDCVILTGTSGSSLSLAQSGTWGTLTVDTQTTTGTLAIRIHNGGSATVGVNEFGTGITDFHLISTGGTWKRSSGYMRNKFGGIPAEAGTVENGSMSVDSGGKLYQRMGGVWVQNVGALTNTATIDFPSVADGATASTTVTVTGAIFGDHATASLNVFVPAGVLITAQVTAANTVTVTVFNKSGGAVDLTSATIRATVSRI